MSSVMVPRALAPASPKLDDIEVRESHSQLMVARACFISADAIIISSPTPKVTFAQGFPKEKYDFDDI